MKARILIVEDEAVMANVIADNLESEGYIVKIAPDGITACEMWSDWKPELVLLDVMMPKISGLDVCRLMRDKGFVTPVLFLSAKGSSQERVEGLQAGGNDYMVKPFYLPELLLRIKNLLQRYETRPAQVYSFAGHTIDFRTYTVKLANQRVEILGDRELHIFKLLSEHAGEVVSRDDILDKVWGQDIFPSSRTIDNFMVRLRRIFEPNPAKPVYFHTIWGVGYRFTPEGVVENA
jgi:two-component system alkaline phosphatase synthesis response regulator PhoP